MKKERKGLRGSSDLLKYIISKRAKLACQVSKGQAAVSTCISRDTRVRLHESSIHYCLPLSQIMIPKFRTDISVAPKDSHSCRTRTNAD